MDFVFTLHSHLPWVLHHGRWPHGSDWLCEAAVDTYLPLIEALDLLAADDVPAPLTIGVTPILASQLAHPDFVTEVEAFLAQRLEACNEAESDFAKSGESHLIPQTGYWRVRLERLRNRLRSLGGGITGELAAHARAGRIELLSSAATHGFLPLLRRPESVRLQLAAGRSEHVRIFGREPAGLWLPECAYRAGLEEPIADAGYQYFFVDAHMASAGRTLGLYGETGFVDGVREPALTALDAFYPRSPYRAYEVGTSGRVSAFVRDPESTLRVWSRHQGYPGDGGYLEFHKIRWPGGLKLWRVTASDVDLGAKEPYDPNVARARSHRHAAEYGSLLGRIQRSVGTAGGEVIATPFDTELFGHWWFEGVDFIGDLYRGLAASGSVRPATASKHLDGRAGGRDGGQRIELAQGSWGANGDFSKWQNPETQWTWDRLWGLEDRFWNTMRRSLPGIPSSRLPVLAQAARELLLAQSSDWQFIISTGAAGDYAAKRFKGHCEALENLLHTIETGTDASALMAEHGSADDCFPDVGTAVRRVVLAD
jgi:1,4-alpha-glucan branching enzyme